MRIKKAVIPAAGLGTRFLPASKAIPKELFPIIDRPVTQLIAEEMAASGVEKVVFVINEEKEAIKKHYKKDERLEKYLAARDKKDALQEIKKINGLCDFSFVYQNEPKGNGHAVLCAEKEIKNEPFFVNWADDLIIGKKIPYFAQLQKVYQKHKGIILSVMKTDAHGQERYGIIKPKRIAAGVCQVLSVVEKPGSQKAPSNLASIGGFVLTPLIFKVLKKTKPGKGGEIWLQDAINELCKKQLVYAYEFDGAFYDVGEKLGYLKTIVKMGLKNPSTKIQFKKFLEKVV